MPKQLAENRLMNDRPIALAAIGLILGIMISVTQFAFWIFLIIAAAACFFIYKLWSMSITEIEKNEARRKKIFLCVFLCAVILGILIGLISLWYYTLGIRDIEGEVTGRIIEVTNKGSVVEVLLENASDKAGYLRGRVKLTIPREALGVSVGDRLSVSGSFVPSAVLEEGKVNSYIYKNKITYISTKITDAYVFGGDRTLAENIRAYFKQLFSLNMSDDAGAISYAMLFGDTSMMNGSVLNSFRVIGIGHLFAVSGLHVGVFFGFITKIMNLLRVNKTVESAIGVAAVFGYSYLCGLTPSAIRASVMLSVFSLSQLCNASYDKINSISIAAIVVLLLSPFDLFSYGFILSFMTMLSIIAFSPIFARKLYGKEKTKQVISANLSAQIGTFPLVSYMFGYISPFSILLNFVFIPFFSFIYVYNLVASLFSVVVTINFLAVSSFAIELVSRFLQILASYPITNIPFVMSTVTIGIYFVILFLKSDYLFLEKDKRSLCLAILVACFLLSLVGYDFKINMIFS